MASAALRWLLDLLFPARCLGCGQRGGLLCAGCEPTVPYLPPAACPTCARPATDGQRCSRCRAAAPALDGVRAVCWLEGPVRRGIHQLKYRRARVVADWLAGLLLASLAARPLLADLVVPVPVPPDRLRQRGFNQAELLARPVAAATGAPLAPGLLVRTRPTRPQVGLGAAERRRNVRGAFACLDPAAVRGRRVLVVDDVLTTGATLDECARALKAAGASQVYGLAVAREA